MKSIQTNRLLKDLDALLITHPTNVRYLTGFLGADPRAREAYVLLCSTNRGLQFSHPKVARPGHPRVVTDFANSSMRGMTKDKLWLLTSALYRELAKKIAYSRPPAAECWEIKFVEISKENPLAKQILKILCQELKINQLGFEADNLTVTELTNLKRKLTNIKLLPTQNLVETVRQIKRVDEIENIKQACQITDQCFEYIQTQIKPKVTETEIAWKIEKYIREKEAQLAFSPIVAFGKNSSQPHYSPSNDQRLKTNDLVLLDFGARVNGYCADMTRVLYIGKIPSEINRAYDIVKSTQEKIINTLSHISKNKPGKLSGAKLDHMAQNMIKMAGLTPYPHSLGHGVGLDIHELPRLTFKKDVQLQPNMVFSIEPAVYLEGKFGIRIEDLVLLKENEIEILTKSCKQISILSSRT